jgi:DNA-binding CsgD family transcriptional regulator
VFAVIASPFLFVIDREKILELRTQGLSMRKIAAELGISVPRVCQIINMTQ